MKVPRQFPVYILTILIILVFSSVQLALYYDSGWLALLAILFFWFFYNYVNWWYTEE